MVNKRSEVINLIKKLSSLGINDDEIVNQLMGANLSRADAIELVKEAKSPPKKVLEAVEEKESLSMDDQIAKQIPFIKESNADIKKENPQEVNAKGNDEFGLKVKQTTPQKNEINAVKEKFNNEKRDDEIADFIVSEQNPEVKEEKQNNGGKVEVKPFDLEQLKKELGMNIEKNEEQKEKKSISTLQKEESFKELPQQKKVSETKPFFESKSFPKAVSSVSSGEVEELWKKGIVVTINSRLAEMKQLKEEIDSSINDKVDSAVRKETQQLKVLLNSQKELIVSTNKAALDEKQREITFIIDSKIAEIKKQSKELGNNVKAIEDGKAEQEESLVKIRQVLDEAKKTKVQLLVEMNSEMIKSKSQAQSFIDEAEKHVKELDSRVNKTLEFEKNIAEGLVQEAENKIEKLTLQKADDLIERLEVKLNNIEASAKNIDVDALEQKINILDEFKKQFIIAMQENITQINSAIHELNKKNEQLDSLLQEKTLAIDAKIEELTKFEKEFEKRMDKIINKK